MKNFEEYIKKNKKAVYAIAKVNCKHDDNGTCLFSKSDPWMQENCWDEDSLEAITDRREQHYAGF